jgi:tetratricopeptide (TPR) repeat protein
MIFFKYRSDSPYTQQIITSGKIYLATAAELNDPFECSLQEIGHDWIQEEIKKLKQAGLSGFIMSALKSIKDKTDFFGLSLKETKEMLEHFKGMDLEEASAYREQIMLKQTGHPPSNSQNMFSQIDAQLLSVGIFSMSTNPENSLMWAHYSGNHSGICLGFKKTPEGKLSNPDHFLKVIYSDKLPEMDKDGFQTEIAFSVDAKMRMYPSSFKLSFTDKTFQKAIVTKPTCWSYEDEWRYVEPYPGLFDWPGTLNDITFGLKMTEDRIEHYVKIIEEHVPYSVSLYQMRKKHGTNELERTPFEKSRSSPQKSSNPVQNTNNHQERFTAEEFNTKMERLIRQEKYGEVIFQVDENLRTYPNNADLLNLKGMAHGFSQEPEKALECFQKITELHPQVAHGWYQKACALIDLKRDKEAIESLKIAYKLNPNDASIAFNLGIEILKTDGSPKDALTYFIKAEKLGHRKAHSYISDIEKYLKA